MVRRLLGVRSTWLLMFLLSCGLQVCATEVDESVKTQESLGSKLTVLASEASEQVLASYLQNPIATRFDLVKSENDQRQYRYITLANNLKVLLISDPAAEKSAAALSVNIGANQNPIEREGLAHFLEHMLFLGTQKYPEPGEYQAFIAQHGGTYNAYTAAENTNYFFEIDNSKLEPALDRFAQFFIAPLFNADYVERERNAVHSEYVAKLKDDARREWDVYRELMNPEHPSAKFSVGNHVTLADRGEASVRTDLLNFYRRYYAAHLMNLVVMGRESLEQLETLVATRFVQVAEHDVELDDKYP
jgi:insulysin